MVQKTCKCLSSGRETKKIQDKIFFDFYNNNVNHEWKKRAKLEVNWFGCITLSKEQRTSDFHVLFIPTKQPDTTEDLSEAEE